MFSWKIISAFGLDIQNIKGEIGHSGHLMDIYAFLQDLNPYQNPVFSIDYDTLAFLNKL